MIKAIDNNENEVFEAVERPYKLRKLVDGDLIPLLSLLRHIGFTEFREVLLPAADGKSTTEIGLSAIIRIAEIIISKLLDESKAEYIYQFYSGLCGMSVEEMKNLEFGSVPLMVYDSITDMKNTSFFKVLAKLL